VQRDTRAPAVEGRPNGERHENDFRCQTQYSMRPHNTELNQKDNRSNRQPIADDGESPRVIGISDKDRPAH